MTDNASSLHRADVLCILNLRGIEPEYLNLVGDDRWEAEFYNPGGVYTALIEPQIERIDAAPFVLLAERRAEHAIWVTFQEVES